MGDITLTGNTITGGVTVFEESQGTIGTLTIDSSNTLTPTGGKPMFRRNCFGSCGKATVFGKEYTGIRDEVYP